VYYLADDRWAVRGSPNTLALLSAEGDLIARHVFSQQSIFYGLKVIDQGIFTSHTTIIATRRI
jgi:hypothetical protein